VEQRSHPVLVGADVGEHPYVALPVDVGAERMWILARPFEQITARQDFTHIEADAGKIAPCHVEHVDPGVDGRQVRREHLGTLLEERIVVMPWPQRRGVDGVARRKARIGTGFGGSERIARERVQHVEAL